MRTLTQYEALSESSASNRAGSPAATAADESRPAGLDVRSLEWIRPLVGEYAFNFQKLSQLYAGDPAKPDSWRQAIARVHSQPRDPAIAGVIATQQAGRGAPPRAQEAAARLADPRAVVIATGQQAGVFGGPLFTLLKAATAIQLATKITREHNVPAVPVFWVDAEDHDWQEIRSCTILDAEFQPKTITLPNVEGAGELPIAQLTLDDRINAAINDLLATLPTTDFTTELGDTIRRAYRPRAKMAEAFSTWIESILGPHGLVVFEAADPAAKSLAAPVFVRELESPGRTAALAASGGERLRALGHQPQVAPQEGSVSLFHLDGARQPIRREGDQFFVGDTPVTLKSLLDEARTNPGRFSPNVLLRPLVQDTLFPTICYVSGPSELAYLGQLREVYEHFDIPMPLIYPRASATLIDGSASRFLNKHQMPLDALRSQDESALNQLLQSQLPPEIEESLKNAEDTLRGALQRVIDAMRALDPTLAGAAKTTMGKMEHDLKSLQGKVIQAAKRRDETLRRQFVRAQAQIFPLGHPQERTLTLVYFINRYGPGLVDTLLRTLPMELGRHWVVTL
ncbi:MAG TPA: bacillithiol biosynthesis cysteine-adding enzyme BshC [Vicinamibacterales bacterium]|nr:bacillithiol biosynthesis cysteine-adding enzyme BshC [Vicinamibacterales bacterium]